MTDLANFTDESLNQSLRRRAEYDDNEPGNLVLKVPTQAGGHLTLPLVERARSNIEQEEYQENTLLRIKPLAEIQSNLPVKSGGLTFHTGRSVALLRPGYFYVFRGDALWRELEINTEGMMSDIDVQSARSEWEAEPSDTFRARPAVGEWQHDILVPAMLQGQTVIQDIRVAYSEVQWDWHYVRRLEQDAKSLRIRTTRIDHAWPAALVDDINFASGYPASPIQQVDGLRARDLGIELMLENPSDFKLGFEGPGEGELCVKLADRIKQAKEKSTDPIDLELTCGPGEDLINGHREQKGLVCIALPDPLFQLRHSLVQLHLALHYLDAVDISIQSNPIVHSAMLIRQAIFDPRPDGGPSDLSRYASAIDRQKLDKVLDTEEKDHAIRVIENHVERAGNFLTEPSFAAALNDYRESGDHAICEAYLLATDLMNVLQQIPGVVKAQGKPFDDGIYATLKNWITDERFLEAWAPQEGAGKGDESGPGTSFYQKLVHLAQNQTEIDEALLDRLNLQSLAYLEHQIREKDSGDSALKDLSNAGKVGGLISGALSKWSTAILTVSRRLIEQGAVEQIELLRVMQAAASNMVLADPDLAGIRVMDRARAVSQGTILGLQGNGLNRGLTEFDRTEGVLTRKNDYLYADLFEESGQTMASTSPARAAAEFEDTINKVAAGTMVFYVAEGHEEAKKLSLVKVDFAKREGRVVDGPAVSRGLVALAAFNLFVEFRSFLTAYDAEQGNSTLAFAKTFGGATADLIAAQLKLNVVLGDLGLKQASTYQFASRPLFDLKNWWFVGKRLEKIKASTLVRTAGLANFIAGGIGVGLSFWEMRISLSNNDFDAAAGHGIAMSGGVVFLVSPLMANLLAVPGWGWALFGMAMVVGGGLYAGMVADDSFEKLLKHGPLGDFPNNEQSWNDDKAYYGQLITLLSPIHVSGERYADIEPDSALFNSDYPPEPDDYVVTIRFPLVSRIKLLGQSRTELPDRSFKLVVQEIAYHTSTTTIPSSVAVTPVSDTHMLKATPLTKIVARQSLPRESAVRFLVRRELKESEYQSIFYRESVTTRLRVGLQATLETELGPLVFPTPAYPDYEPFDVTRHMYPPPKRRTILDPFAQPKSPYWYFAEVNV
ncbi:hypothetical protein DET50_11754 [Marinobacter pelagius]|uniref:Toxin VasX N-terminal region domain-containing protein n=1 Tax=Marinobacter pelagius TaxID=379482 RepID=A0A366GHU0_9GAMM|nr:toxin VasX [Marinobacter pelagius]RBP26563.1 hypothetical protein DET50_11754 [Marinobacter pelagius]